MGKLIESSGNIFVPFNGTDPAWQQSTVIGLDDPDTVYGGALDDDEITIISSGGAGLIEGWLVQANSGDDEVDLWGSSIGVLADLGTGDDELNFEDGEAETAFLNTTVIGGLGNDIIDAEVGGSHSLFDLGDGNDNFYGDDNYSFITVLGGEGNDYAYVDDFLTKSQFVFGNGQDYFSSDDSIVTTLLDGGAENDRFYIDNYNYLRNISLLGGDGDDEVDFDGESDEMSFSLIDLGSGVDDFYTESSFDRSILKAGFGNDYAYFSFTSSPIKKSSIFLDDGDDDLYIKGSVSSSTIAGGNGNDYIGFTYNGIKFSDSSIAGGSGNDGIGSDSANLSAVTVSGGADNDKISFVDNTGSDTISSSYFVAGSGNDLLTLRASAMTGTTVIGGTGNDSFNVDYDDGKVENSCFFGEAGEDSFLFETDISNSKVAGGADAGTFTFQIADTYTGLSLTGGNGNDTVTFEESDATVTGSDFKMGAGDDELTLEGGFVSTGFTLGGGNDSLLFNDTPGGFDMVVVSAGDGNDLISDNGYDLTFESSTVTGADGNDTISFDFSDGVDGSGLCLMGGNGNDEIYSPNTGGHTVAGGAGDDWLVTHDGNDSIVGGSGLDDVGAGIGNDTVLGGGEIDFIFGDYSDDTVVAGVGGSDSILGGTGNDLIFGGFVGEDDAANTLAGDFYNAADSVNSVEGTDIIVGGNNNDTIYAYANTSVAGAGSDDTLIGAGGNDTIVGSAEGGNWLFGDVYDGVDAETDAGTDVAFADINYVSKDGLDFSAVNAALDPATQEQNTSVPSVFGNGDTIAMAYADAYGADSIVSALIADILNEEVPNDYDSYQVAGADSIVGGNGDNVIFGGGDNDTITSGSGNDVIVGGVDADSMTGGAGNDLFIQKGGSSIDATDSNTGTGYTVTFGDGVDIITDFVAAGPSPDFNRVDKIAFEFFAGDNEAFVNNVGSPSADNWELGDVVIFRGTFQETGTGGKGFFATGLGNGEPDILAFRADTADYSGTSTWGGQAVVLLGAGNQAFTAANFV